MEKDIFEGFEREALEAVMTVVQDGICFLNKDLDILGSNSAMQYWYSHQKEAAGQKCYKVYHDRNEPCRNCPVLRAFTSGRMESAEQFYEKNNKKEGWQKIFCVPVKDHSGKVVFVVEYIRDMTNEKRSELSLELMQDQMDNYKLMAESRENLERQKQNMMMSSYKKSVRSVLSYLERILDERSFQIVKTQLESARSGMDVQDQILSRLSEKEVMVARYIADGYMSKEIAEEMMISKKTVDYHRSNIRKRLGLSDKDNLTDYLKKHLL